MLSTRGSLFEPCFSLSSNFSQMKISKVQVWCDEICIFSTLHEEAPEHWLDFFQLSLSKEETVLD